MRALVVAFCAFCTMMVVLGTVVAHIGRSDIFYAEKPVEAFNPLPANTTNPLPANAMVVDKTSRFEERVMLYDEKRPFDENLKLNIMPRSEAEAKLPLGGVIIAHDRNGAYVLPPVDVAEYLLEDGTPVSEAEFHEQEASVSKLAGK